MHHCDTLLVRCTFASLPFLSVPSCAAGQAGTLSSRFDRISEWIPQKDTTNCCVTQAGDVCKLAAEQCAQRNRPVSANQGSFW